VDEQLKNSALEYHRLPRPGKIAILPTKQLTNQRDLALAYSPGVAFACTEIAQDPAQAAVLTSRANLVAVITNGTAVLFKKFAGIDVFGPILLGASRAAHILTPSATVRRIVNMTALTVVDAGAPRDHDQTLF